MFTGNVSTYAGRLRTSVCAALLFAVAAFSSNAPAQVVFSQDFDTSLPAAIDPGVATLTGVQGYAGLGHPGNQFGGQFLRSPTGNLITLTLTNLPPHTAINLDFLLAAIDSLDGTGNYPEGDFLHINLDGVQIFRESFANASPSQIQSYVPPPGGELARHVDLGFSGPGGYYTDSAYDMSVDPVFHHLAHAASTATFTFIIEGPGIQSLDDESWAMDNLRISVEGTCGTADFNCDGDIGTDSDIAAFFACISGTCPPAPCTNSADFNGDGDLGTDADIEAFFRVLSGGHC
jgi:hypothetical protein